MDFVFHKVVFFFVSFVFSCVILLRMVNFFLKSMSIYLFVQRMTDDRFVIKDWYITSRISYFQIRSFLEPIRSSTCSNIVSMYFNPRKQTLKTTTFSTRKNAFFTSKIVFTCKNVFFLALVWLRSRIQQTLSHVAHLFSIEYSVLEKLPDFYSNFAFSALFS